MESVFFYRKLYTKSKFDHTSSFRSTRAERKFEMTAKSGDGIVAILGVSESVY